MKKENKFEIDEIIDELMKFSSNVITLNLSVEYSLIKQFEEETQIELPNDYKYLISKVNGFNLMGDEILGITYLPNSDDLVEVYRFEHFEVFIPQYLHLVPFSPDGRGNFYCFDTKKKTRNNDSCCIVFWRSNYEYTESDPPEIVYNCLSDFIKECVIGWTLEDYDYDGNPT